MGAKVDNSAWNDWQLVETVNGVEHSVDKFHAAMEATLSNMVELQGTVDEIKAQASAYPARSSWNGPADAAASTAAPGEPAAATDGSWQGGWGDRQGDWGSWREHTAALAATSEAPGEPAAAALTIVARVDV